MSLLSQQSSPPLADGQPLLSAGCFKKVPPPTRVVHGEGGEPTALLAFDGDGMKFASNGGDQSDRHDASSSELFLPHDQRMHGMTDAGGLDSAWTAAMEFTSLEGLSQHVYQNGNLFGEASSFVY